MCEAIEGEVLGKGAEVNGRAFIDGFALDQADEVEDSLVDDGFEIGNFLCCVLPVTYWLMKL